TEWKAIPMKMDRKTGTKFFGLNNCIEKVAGLAPISSCISAIFIGDLSARSADSKYTLSRTTLARMALTMRRMEYSFSIRRDKELPAGAESKGCGSRTLRQLSCDSSAYRFRTIWRAPR